jgi:hypothetical protein
MPEGDSLQAVLAGQAKMQQQTMQLLAALAAVSYALALS